MDKRELLDLYEARGGDEIYEQARRLYEAALAEDPGDAVAQRDYGYLLECHARYMLEAAARAYERAIELDPDAEKAHFQLIRAQAALGRHDEAIARYEGGSQHRLLAYAHVAAHDFAAADRVLQDGLARSPDDPVLVGLQGDVLAATGHPDEALAAWQRALELDPETISGHYSRAFLLEREGRVAEAAAEWRAILEWSLARGYELDAEWPRRELARLETIR